MNQYDYYGLGAIKDKKDRRDYCVEDILGAAVELPNEYSVAEIDEIDNQHHIPDCVARATTKAKEPQECIDLSARDLYSRCKESDGNLDWGTSFRTAQMAMQDWGVAEERLVKSDTDLSVLDYITVSRNLKIIENAAEHKNSSYYSIGKKLKQNDYFEDVRQAMFQFKARAVSGCQWFTSYNKLSAPFIIDKPFGYLQGGHAWYINGWKQHNGETVLVAVNSFGDGWGDKGKFYIRKDWFNKHAYFGWINIDLPKKLPVDLFYGQQRTWTGFLKEQAMVAYWTPRLKRLPSHREIKAAIYGFWDKEALFNKRVGDAWLYCTKIKWNELMKTYSVEDALALIKV